MVDLPGSESQQQRDSDRTHTKTSAARIYAAIGKCCLSPDSADMT